MRPLGIPTALDRTIQQAVAQPISDFYEKVFSDSYRFCPNRSCHNAIKQALEYLNDGYEWVIDIDIEQFFDKVNHDKLIQILREQVNDSSVLNLIQAKLYQVMREYLKRGKAIARPLTVTIERVILIKQWKKPKGILKNLSYLNRKYKNGFNSESIFKVANSRLG